jgi:hypothetical protein
MSNFFPWLKPRRYPTANERTQIMIVTDYFSLSQRDTYSLVLHLLKWILFSRKTDTPKQRLVCLKSASGAGSLVFPVALAINGASVIPLPIFQLRALVYF